MTVLRVVKRPVTLAVQKLMIIAANRLAVWRWSGLVSTETDDLNNTQADGHNSEGIVHCENVENDKVEHESSLQNDHLITKHFLAKNKSVRKTITFGRTSCEPNSNPEIF